MVKLPKIGIALKKKHGGKSALFLDGKIVHIGGFSTQKQYRTIMIQLKKKYPRAKEEDFGITYIPANHPYIL